MNLSFVDVNHQRLALWERPGDGTPILFVHATGFHARCWNQIIHQLPGRHCYAPDMRGHGLSSKPDPPYHWRWFSEDIAALARALNFTGIIAAGHSMGGHSLLLAASLVPGAFSHLVLIDPVIMPRDYYRPRTPEPHFARKRRNRWTSPDEMRDRFRDRLPFRDWDPAVLDDYCRFGLVPDGGGFVLACPPDVEGSIYENSGQPEADLYPLMPSIRTPVTIIRSERSRMSMDGPSDMAASPTAPDLASHFPNARDIVVNHSHFIPMESPGTIARALSAL